MRKNERRKFDSDTNKIKAYRVVDKTFECISMLNGFAQGMKL